MPETGYFSKEILKIDYCDDRNNVNVECLDAFRLRRRHGFFPFTSGLPRVKGKNNSQRVTKAHLDSPRVTSGEATSDEWGIKMGLE